MLGRGSRVLVTFLISSPVLVLFRRCEIDEFVSWAGAEKENQRIFEVPLLAADRKEQQQAPL